jgi:hypothetical protein
MCLSFLSQYYVQTTTKHTGQRLLDRTGTQSNGADLTIGYIRGGGDVDTVSVRKRLPVLLRCMFVLLTPSLLLEYMSWLSILESKDFNSDSLTPIGIYELVIDT